MRTSPCPACRHDVPSGRWCNRCGGPLERRATPAPRGRRWGLAVVVVLVGLGAAGALTATRDDPTARSATGTLDSAVVLAEDAPAPPARPSSPPAPPGERVEVICSDLSVRSVPVDLVTTDEPGELVELANGTCVVMDPNGVVTP